MKKEKPQEMIFKMAFDSSENIESEVNPEKSHGVKIVILQRGWVAVGELFYQKENGFLEGVLKNSKTIRIWGTTKGLGEIALNGPIKDKTVLDKCGTLRFNVGCEVAIIDCESSKWEL